MSTKNKGLIIIVIFKRTPPGDYSCNARYSFKINTIIKKKPAQTKSIDWFPFDENNQLKWGKVRSVDIPYGQNIQVQWYANLNSWTLYESIRQFRHS